MNSQKTLFHHIGDWWLARQSQSPGSAEQHTFSKISRLLRWITPNGGTLILIALLIFTQNIWAGPLLSNLNAPGASATTINYQGRLADSSGNPKDGTFSMSFAIYDAATGGNLVWGPETHAAVPVSGGLFSVGLGSQTTGGIPTTVWNGDRYLEVTVGGETLSPRELIRSVPIAGMALTVPDGAITAEKISDDTLIRTFAETGTKIQYGSFWYESDTCDTQVVTFPQPFTTKPLVFISQNEATSGFGGFVTTHPSPTQFSIHKFENCSTSASINWIAIGN